MTPEVDDEGNVHETNLVPLGEAAAPVPAPTEKAPLTREDLDLLKGIGGSNVGVASEDDDRALDTRGGDREREVQSQLPQRTEDGTELYEPQVEGRAWVPEDKGLLESFGHVAAELDLSPAQQDGLAKWFVETAEAQQQHRLENIDTFHFSAEDAIDASPLTKAMSTAFKEFAINAGMSVDAADGVVTWFIDQSRDQITALDAGHRGKSIEDLRLSWGAQQQANVKLTKEYLNSLGPLGKVLKNARAADGRLLIYTPGFAQFIHGISTLERQGPAGTKSSASPEAAYERGLRREAQEIRGLREQSADAYYGKPWRQTGKTADRRLVEIEAELEGRTRGLPQRTQAQRVRDLADEKRELLALEERDAELFSFGKWRETNLTPEQRFHQIAAHGR